MSEWRRVVSNSGPLISLGGIGLLDLLRELYGQILIPEAVHAEVVVDGAGLAGSRAVEDASWIRHASRQLDRDLVAVLGESLGAGEAEAIALARAADADLLLLDDGRARHAARRMGLPIRGTLGVLFEGKREGLVADVAPRIEQLLERGFRASERVVEEALRRAGEG